MALTLRSRYMAAVLACGPGALLSHRSAGHLWQLLSASWARIEVTAPRSRGPRHGIALHRTRVIHPDDRAVIDGIPVTSVARTIVDLADLLDDRRLSNAVNEADVHRILDLTAIKAVLDRLPGRTGRHRLQRVLVTYRSEPRFTRSEGERRLLRVCADHRLLKPLTNISVAGYELDAYWPDARLGIEFDGFEFHCTRRAFHRDRRRDLELGAVGIQVNRLTWPDFADEADLADRLRRVRAARLQAA